jgi:uncharacterized membrane protein YtjA (UPF0391 family)
MAAPVALLPGRTLQPGTRFSKGSLCHDRLLRCGQEPVPHSEVSVPVTGEGPPIAAANVSELAMTILKWALIFLLVSIVAGVLGFTGLSAASADIARFLFYVFVVIFLVLVVLGLTLFRA